MFFFTLTDDENLPKVYQDKNNKHRNRKSYYVKSGKLEIKRYIKSFVALFITALAIIVFGKNVNEGLSLEILNKRGVHPTYGIFYWNIDERH